MLFLAASLAFAGDPAPAAPPVAAEPVVDPCVVIPAAPAVDATTLPTTPAPPAPPAVGATPPVNCPTAPPATTTAPPAKKSLKKSNDNRMEAESTDE